MPEYAVYYDAVIHFSGVHIIEAASSGEAHRIAQTRQVLSEDLTDINADHIVKLIITDVEEQ